VKIGNVETKGLAFLAPMAGVTDMTYRRICMEHGCGLGYSEMVSAKAISYKNVKTVELTRNYEHARPLTLQLFGHEPEFLYDGIKRLEDAQLSEFDIIDINMGCPAPKIFKNGDGSALMRSPKLVEEMVKAAVRATSKPVTIKTRRGIDFGDEKAVEIAKAAESGGASAVAIHARYREQYYSGSAEWDVIAQVKQAVKVPVIGNGDVVSGESAAALMKQTGCDAVMIGRAAMGNPWIFTEVNAYLAGELFTQPSVSERMATALEHSRMIILHKGEYIGVREMRKHLGWYCKGIKASAKIRAQMNTMETLSDVEKMANTIINDARDYNV